MSCFDLMKQMIEENFKIDGVITKPPKNLSCEDYISIFNYFDKAFEKCLYTHDTTIWIYRQSANKAR